MPLQSQPPAHCSALGLRAGCFASPPLSFGAGGHSEVTPPKSPRLLGASLRMDLGAHSNFPALPRGNQAGPAAQEPSRLSRHLFKGSPSLNASAPYSHCFAFSFCKHLIIALINTFWDNSSWLSSNLNQHLLAYCRLCAV